MAISARGTSGGLTTLCCEEKFHLKRWFVTHHWIFIELFHNSSKTSLALFNLYVPVNFNEKKDCWKSLSEYLVVNSPSTSIIPGHLNITLTPNEKKGGVVGKDYFQDSIEALIQDWDLINFKPKKGRYTWSNNRIGAANIVAQLDRFLVKTSLMDGKFVISSKILPKL